MVLTKRFYLKAFLYFGGAAIILLGGAIIIMAPYNYIGFNTAADSGAPFTLFDDPNYYHQLEISVTVKPNNVSIVKVDFTVVNNETLEVRTLNMTLTDPEDVVPGTNPKALIHREILNLEPGNYTVYVDHIEGADWIDLSLDQLSNKKFFVAIGAALNIAGLIMCGTGYMISGSMFASDDIIIDWGYDEEEGSYHN
ncbi:MAG: hypothetical protein ACTSYL_10550 [Candidatus Thorarchaeota archaeon]